MGGIAQQGQGFLAVLFVEQPEQALGDAGGQLLEEGGAVVGGQLGQDVADFLLRHFLQQAVLDRRLEKRKHVVGQMAGQDAEKQDAVLVGDGGQQFGDFRGGLLGEEFAQLVEAAFLEQFKDFRQQQVAQDHGKPPRPRAGSRAGCRHTAGKPGFIGDRMRETGGKLKQGRWRCCAKNCRAGWTMGGEIRHSGPSK